MLARTRTPLLLALFFFPTALNAQQPGQKPAASPEELQQLVLEAQQIQEKLQPVQQKALQDTAVQPQVAQFQRVLRAKMVELDPRSRALLDRLDEIEKRLQEAQAGAGV